MSAMDQATAATRAKSVINVGGLAQFLMRMLLTNTMVTATTTTIEWRVTMIKTNTKLKPDGIYSFGIAPMFTCPAADSCQKYCYACKGNYARFTNVLESLIKAYELTEQANFVELMVKAITKKKGLKYVRIHTEGDFYNQEYLNKWTRIMRLCPNIQFYCYTKSLHLDWSEALALPNFKRIQSTGGKYDDLIDYSQPHARIFKSAEALKQSNYVDSSESDLVAATSKSPNIGLIFH
jgi:hypothetical protein